MKKKHNKIQVKFSLLKTWHNGVDEDWRCFVYRLGKFQSPSQGSRKGRNQKSPHLQLFRARFGYIAAKLSEFDISNQFLSLQMSPSIRGYMFKVYPFIHTHDHNNPGITFRITCILVYLEGLRSKVVPSPHLCSSGLNLKQHGLC